MTRIKDGIYEIMIDNQWFIIVGYSSSKGEIEIVPEGTKIDVLTDGRKTIKIK